MGSARYNHTATLLRSGKVLVAGGYNGSSYFSSAELFDPAGNGGAGTWTTLASSMANSRYLHTATLLASGKVLIAGGSNGSYLYAAEVFDPAGAGSWTSVNSMVSSRQSHTATLLANGKVLVAGGNNGNNLTAAELFDPAGGTWTSVNPMATARYSHAATLLDSGKVLIAGGFNTTFTSAAELFDPGTGTWAPTGSMNGARAAFTMRLLPGGKGDLLVAGGYGNSPNGYLLTAEKYIVDGWTGTTNMVQARASHAATLLVSGKVLVSGGVGANFSPVLNTVELFDPAGNAGAGSWSQTTSMHYARMNHTATRLNDGKVVVASGTTAEVFNPANSSWTDTANNLHISRDYHSATLLQNGKVLVAGGHYGSPYGEELYDPSTGSWTQIGALTYPRKQHTATLLTSGKVLIASGKNSTGAAEDHNELYDPAVGANGTWSVTGSFPNNSGGAHHHANGHLAALLFDGKVLAAGGDNIGTGASAIVDLYDPATGIWTTGVSMVEGRYYAPPIILGSGVVLAAAGAVNDFVETAQYYVPITETGLPKWTFTKSLATKRDLHTTTLLLNGKVLAAGGTGPNPVPESPAIVLSSAELFTP
jgi:N-acetylneuraminic acid mutarotase